LDKKYILFIVGEYNSGKSTLIRGLTGSWKCKVVNVKDLRGQPLNAFVSLSAPQELGLSKHPPSNFPASIEQKYRVSRNDYKLLISALELVISSRSRKAYGYEQYINSVQRQGFDIRLAVIKNSWDNKHADPYELSNIQNFAKQVNITQPLLLVDASNDPNEEANKIRRNLYP